jgi:hypothetical protein
MTRTQPNRAARRRGESTRDRGSRRLSPAIDAQRRLNARPAPGTPTNVDSFVSNDRRYAYLTRSYDGEALAIRLAQRGDGSAEDGKNEREFYREILRRANMARDRGAESLRLSRRLRHRRGDLGAHSEAASTTRWRKWSKRADPLAEHDAAPSPVKRARRTRGRC